MNTKGLSGRIWRRGRKLLRDAALFVPAKVMGTITHVNTAEPLVALTFDDGPDATFTPQLLDILDRYDARATFFVVGKAAHDHPDLLQAMSDRGHALGNHSWDHPSFPAISQEQRLWQLSACESLIQRHSHRLFRPPYCNLTFSSRYDLFRLRYRVVAYDVIGNDWRDDDAKTIFTKLESKIHAGCIVLLHDALFTAEDKRYASRTATLEAVEMLLERFRPMYRFVTVPEMLSRGRAVSTWWHQPGDAGYLSGLHETNHG